MNTQRETILMAAFTERGEHLGHLWAINRGVQDYNPEGCDGCKEVNHFLTDPTYRGDTHYPAWDRLDDRDWELGPDDFEKVSESDRAVG